jgi:hypothetical protein
VAACRYPPQGRRSYGPGRGAFASRWGGREGGREGGRKGGGGAEDIMGGVLLRAPMPSFGLSFLLHSTFSNSRWAPLPPSLPPSLPATTSGRRTPTSPLWP